MAAVFSRGGRRLGVGFVVSLSEYGSVLSEFLLPSAKNWMPPWGCDGVGVNSVPP